jgi:nitrogen regulatory protein P-II 1
MMRTRPISEEAASHMKLITAVVKPDIADDLVIAVTEAGARGLTAVEAIGFGQQYGHGSPPDSPAVPLPKIRVDIVVRDADAETVTNAIAKCANTGTIGDGKIWVSTVDNVIRVRTGERDDSAL